MLPDRDTYTLTFDAPANIDSIRLEVLKDGKKVGPGRNSPHGNFVLSEIVAATAASIGGGGQPTPVKFVQRRSRFLAERLACRSGD